MATDYGDAVKAAADVTEADIVARLKRATVTLRDTGQAHQRAQSEYREALQAFNRFVAPETAPA